MTLLEFYQGKHGWHKNKTSRGDTNNIPPLQPLIDQIESKPVNPPDSCGGDRLKKLQLFTTVWQVPKIQRHTISFLPPTVSDRSAQNVFELLRPLLRASRNSPSEKFRSNLWGLVVPGVGWTILWVLFWPRGESDIRRSEFSTDKC